MQVKRWKQMPEAQNLHQELMQSGLFSELVCRILSGRFSTYTVADIVRFFATDITFESPFALQDMEAAVERIQIALEEEQTIAIYGDYDCDGITSTVLLMHYFQSVGANVFYYIPQREGEGYGMNEAAVRQLAQQNVELIITVDNGITAHAEIDLANTLGMDVIVTDHHTPRPTKPNAVAVLNPHCMDCPSSYKEYAGVGVAFQLICALEDADPIEMLDYYGDIVTIGTVADLMVLLQENRAIVEHGLASMNENPRPGISALMEVGALRWPISSETISFGIAPRINAAGRMDCVEQAVELLLTEDEETATQLAENLQELNMQRRKIEEDILLEVAHMLAEQPALLQQRLLIIAGHGWHQGVLGIVASRLLEKYGKPTLVLSVCSGVAKGSGRSMEGFSLIEAIATCSDFLTHYGGHTLAAGITLLEEQITAFTNALQEFAAQQYPIMPVLAYQIDAELMPSDFQVSVIETLKQLEPYGFGNAVPVFAIRDVVLLGVFPTNDKKHIRLKFQKENLEFDSIYFHHTAEAFIYPIGSTLDIIAHVETQIWNEAVQLSVKIKHVRPCNYPEEEAVHSANRYRAFKAGELSKEELGTLLPSRDELALVYRYLKVQGSFSAGTLALWEALLPQGIDLAKVQICIDIFLEAGLITQENNTLLLLEAPPKADLTSTNVWKQLVAHTERR